MKNLFGYVMAFVAAVVLVGCGLQDNECDGERCLDPVCGDSTCDSVETCSTCPSDCGQCPVEPFCGDDLCNDGETCTTCPSDCGQCPVEPFCGDDLCNDGETCETCEGDCGACPVEEYCGDGSCNGTETCSDCEADCGACGPVCGDGVCEDPECVETCPADCEEPECTDCALPDPFRSPAACVFDFSSRYVAGSSCGEVRGTLPLMSWDDGLVIDDPDGDAYMGFAYDTELTPVAAGTYDLSYLGYQDCDTCGDESCGEAWALYGHIADLRRMSTVGRSFLECNWYDAETDSCIDAECPSCHIRIAVDADCNVTAAGNMAGLNDTSVGC